MADVATVEVETNGYRNATIKATLVSDGSGLAGQIIYDATSTGAFGVNRAGQTFYPGIFTKVVGLDYDVQDLKLRVQWVANTPRDIVPLGSAPEDFNWKRFGGIRVPSGLAGATGSIQLTTVGQVPNATFFLILYLTKGVPQT